MKDFSIVLEELKAKCNVSKDKDIADILGVSTQNLYQWKMRNKIPFENIIEIANKYNIDLNTLFCKQNGYISNNTNTNGVQINGHNHGSININGHNVADEIIEALQKLPKKKKLMYYHKILGDVMEIEE